jgi:ADP-ribose pyrophosphatase YjhB (NUDIX family)
MPMSDYMRSLRARVGSRLLEIPSVSVLVFDERDRVLLVKHAEVDAWTTPGGAVEPEEMLADAAVREAWEETGLHVELLRVLAVYAGPEFTTTYRNGDAVSFAMIVFEGRRLAGSLCADGKETLDVAYFAREELGDVPLQPWVRRVVENALDARHATHFDPPRWRPPGE